MDDVAAGSSWVRMGRQANVDACAHTQSMHADFASLTILSSLLVFAWTET